MGEEGRAVLNWELILAFALGLTLLSLIGWLLLVPMRLMWRLLAGSLLGGGALLLINRFGALFGYALPVNPLTALLSGVLGVPGVALVAVLAALL